MPSYSRDPTVRSHFPDSLVSDTALPDQKLSLLASALATSNQAAAAIDRLLGR